jgi:hypothetical protein
MTKTAGVPLGSIKLAEKFTATLTLKDDNDQLVYYSSENLTDVKTKTLRTSLVVNNNVGVGNNQIFVSDKNFVCKLYVDGNEFTQKPISRTIVRGSNSSSRVDSVYNIGAGYHKVAYKCNTINGQKPMIASNVVPVYIIK